MSKNFLYAGQRSTTKKTEKQLLVLFEKEFDNVYSKGTFKYTREYQ